MLKDLSHCNQTLGQSFMEKNFLFSAQAEKQCSDCGHEWTDDQSKLSLSLSLSSIDEFLQHEIKSGLFEESSSCPQCQNRHCTMSLIDATFPNYLIVLLKHPTEMSYCSVVRSLNISVRSSSYQLKEAISLSLNPYSGSQVYSVLRRFDSTGWVLIRDQGTLAFGSLEGIRAKFNCVGMLFEKT